MRRKLENNDGNLGHFNFGIFKFKAIQIEEKKEKIEFSKREKKALVFETFKI